MRRRTLSLPLAIIIPALIGACGGPKNAAAKSDSAAAPATATTKVDKSADEKAIKDMADRWIAAMKAKNAGPIAADFADDGLELFPGTPAAKGPEGVKKTWGDLMASVKDLNAGMSDEVVTISDSGDLGVLTFKYQMSYTDPKGKKVNDHGTSLTVLKKVNGQWKVLYDTNASEVAPPQ